MLSAQLIEMLDELMVGSFVNGKLADRPVVVNCPALCSPDVGDWVRRRVLSGSSARLKTDVALGAVRPETVHPPGQGPLRFQILERLVTPSARGVRAALSPVHPEGRTNDTRDYVRSALAAVRLSTAIEFIIVLRTLTQLPEPPAILIVVFLLTALALAALGGLSSEWSLNRLPLLDLPIRQMCWALGGVLGIAFFLALFGFAFAVSGLFVDPAMAVSATVYAYAGFWILSIALLISSGLTPAGRTWWFPMHEAFLVLSAELKSSWRREGEESALSSPLQIVLPRNPRPRRRSNLTGLVGSDVLRELDDCSRVEDAAALLKSLQARSSGEILELGEFLEDLGSAFEHVSRFVPAGISTSIPPPLWDVSVQFSQPRFKNWLVEFDRRHPGWLSSLTATSMDTVADLIGRSRQAADA